MNISKKLPLVFLLAFPALLISHTETNLEILAMDGEFDNWAPAFKHEFDQTTLESLQAQRHIERHYTQPVPEISDQKTQHAKEIKQQYTNELNDFHKQSDLAEGNGLAATSSAGCTAITVLLAMGRETTEQIYQNPYIMIPLVVGGLFTSYFTKQWWNHASEREIAYSAMLALDEELCELQKAQAGSEQHK